MYEDINDETKIAKYGEPQNLSKKPWYWECSLCHYREPILKSNLKRKYVQQHSFVKSIDTKEETIDE
jgi:hypothetical protein